MATSISKSVNYKQAAAAPDYQVAARPVDTFVSGTGNDVLSKGKQVAAALEQASGAVARYGQVQAKKAEEVERKATALEKAQAQNQSAAFATKMKLAYQDIDIGEKDTYESGFDRALENDKELATEYTNLLKGYEDNPEVRAFFDNTLRGMTEVPFIELKSQRVGEQQYSTLKDRFSNTLPEALQQSPETGYALAVDTIDTFMQNAEGFGYSKTKAAATINRMMQEFATERTKDANGNIVANVAGAQAFLEKNIGTEKDRQALATVISQQQSYAFNENKRRLERDQLVRNEQLAGQRLQLLDTATNTSDPLPTEAQVRADSSLTNLEQEARIEYVKKLEKAQLLSTSNSNVRLTNLQTDFKMATNQRNWDSMGFDEEPSEAELFQWITDNVTGQLTPADQKKLEDSVPNLLKAYNASKDPVASEIYNELEGDWKTTLSGKIGEANQVQLEIRYFNTGKNYQQDLREQYYSLVQESFQDMFKKGETPNNSERRAIYNEAAKVVSNRFTSMITSGSTEEPQSNVQQTSPIVRDNNKSVPEEKTYEKGEIIEAGNGDLYEYTGETGNLKQSKETNKDGSPVYWKFLYNMKDE